MIPYKKCNVNLFIDINVNIFSNLIKILFQKSAINYFLIVNKLILLKSKFGFTKYNNNHELSILA